MAASWDPVVIEQGQAVAAREARARLGFTGRSRRRSTSRVIPGGDGSSKVPQWQSPRFAASRARRLALRSPQLEPHRPVLGFLENSEPKEWTALPLQIDPLNQLTGGKVLVGLLIRK